MATSLKWAAAPALIALAGCGDVPPHSVVTAASPPSRQVVAVSPVTLTDLGQDLVLTAEFQPFQEVDVMAKVAGYVRLLRVDAGDRVRQGELLARLEVPEMQEETAKAQASLERSRAELERARMEVQRASSAEALARLTAERLSNVAKSRPGMVAQQEVDDTHGRHQMVQAQLSGARSALSAAEQAVRVSEVDLQKSRTLSGYLDITAPFSGVITKRYADQGALVQAGTSSHTQTMPVVRLSQNSRLRLVLPVPESAVPAVRTGARVEVRVPSLDRTFTGRVARSSERIDTATRTMETEVDVPNPGLVLVPGMFAEATIHLQRREAAPSIPIAAYDASEDPRRGTVLLVRNNHIERREVETGLETATRVEVRGGLRPGDLVVVGLRSGLRPGMAVTPKPASGAEGER